VTLSWWIMNRSPGQVRAEFDRIAAASAPADDESQPYDEMLASLIPPNCRRVLELGCGSGRLTNAVAQHVGELIAVDFSPEMLGAARRRCASHRNVVFKEADVLSLPAQFGSFDCVVNVNLLHHLPIEQAARTMKALVAPGGLLLIHDVRRSAGILDRLLDVPRLAVKIAWRMGSANRARAYFRQRAAWAQHAEGDVLATAAEVIEMRARYFPGAEIRQHFLWRYTLLSTRHA
jgi:SAM-dependent methyltransferase